MKENEIIRGYNCKVCTNRKVIIGYNDLYSIYPHIANILKDKNRGYLVSYKSSSREFFICPNCNYEKKYRVSDVISQGFSCPKCSDGISYPNKFMFNVLEQLNIKFQTEYSPNWIKPKRYDFYFEIKNKKYIIEMDGGWHKIENNMGGRTLEETRNIDKYKEDKARENGIEVIRIDSIKSNMDYIKNNILQSKLSNILFLNEIDWLKCHIFSLSSRVRETSDYWNKGYNVTQITNIMKLGRTTINKYLKQATKLNWCKYDPVEETYKSGQMFGGKKKKSIIQFSLDGEYIKEWNSITDASNYLNISKDNIISCCSGRYKQSGGFIWKYKENYNDGDIVKPYVDERYNKRKISIIQLTLDGDFIAEWDGITDAAKELGVNNSNISACCKGRMKSAYGYMWVYKDNYNEKKVKQYTRNWNNTKKKIVQLDLNNKFIKVWNSIAEASKSLNISKIGDCCLGKYKTAGGYKWISFDEYMSKNISQDEKDSLLDDFSFDYAM